MRSPALVAALVVAVASCARPPAKDLTLIYTGDIHGEIAPCG